MDSIKKTYLITNDYTLEKAVLGIGISGKVLSCCHNITGERYALKVSLFI
jgi:hypothetical protein